jgi:hypothetical protein
MPQFASSSFVGTPGQELSAAIPAFSKQTGYTGDIVIGSGGNYVIRNDNVSAGVYQHSGTPASANYVVTADIAVLNSNGAIPQAAVCGRMQAGAQTMYGAMWSESGNNIRLFKWVDGVQTQLGSNYAFTLTTTPARIGLRMVGNQITVELNGSAVIGPITDSSITTAGKSGFYLFYNRETGVSDATSFTNFSADDVGGGDIIAPILTLPTGVAVGSSGATVGATTDEANGTLYAVVTTSVTAPSVAQIKAGQNHLGAAAVWSNTQVVSSIGIKTFSVTGLSPSTGYYAHLVHTDAANNNSNVVSSVLFTTSAGGTPPVITSHPANTTVKSGVTAQFTCAATGSGALTYQWQVNTGSGFTNVNNGAVYSGATSATLSVITTGSFNGYLYRCNVSDDDAGPTATNSATLTVTPCVLLLNAAGYEFGDGNSPATMSVLASTSLQVAVYPESEWPPTTAVVSVTASTGTNGRLADITNVGLLLNTSYRLIVRNNADGETWTWTMTAV